MVPVMMHIGHWHQMLGTGMFGGDKTGALRADRVPATSGNRVRSSSAAERGGARVTTAPTTTTTMTAATTTAMTAAAGGN
jgi:hypothetical protein